MTTITKPSFATRYLCNLKFFIFCCVCVVTITCILYFPYVRKTQEHTNENAADEKPLIIEGPSKEMENTKLWEHNEEIEILREYLQIPSVHPNIDYEPCVEFLKRQAASLDLPVSVTYPVNDKNPVVVLTWKGLQPELPSIMLNSHMDVVPVFEEFWTYPPFAAEIDGEGNIYARGSQDIKSIGVQHLAAIRALKRDGVKQMNRTIHVVFVPDEEVGGYLGMYGFIKSQEFRQMNVGFVLDEGGGARLKRNEIGAYYTERTVWKIELIFHGASGHGAKMIENTPGEKLSYVVSKFMEMRRIESWKLKVLRYTYGRVTSINLTILRGGVQNNVIPAEMRAIFDLRFSADADLEQFENQVSKWCDEAGGNITITYPQKEPKNVASPIDDTNPFWKPFVNAVEEFNLKVVPEIMPAASDARFIRRLNIPAIGFVPYVNSTMLAHDHNEHLNAKVFLFGIEVYKKIIINLTNV